MVTHSNTLAWKSHGPRSLVGCSPWGQEESDMTERLHFHFSLSCTGEGNGSPLQCSCPKNPRDGGAWWAAVYRVAQSRTWLKWLSSSSSLCHDCYHPLVPTKSHDQTSSTNVVGVETQGRGKFVVIFCSFTAAWEVKFCSPDPQSSLTEVGHGKRRAMLRLLMLHLRRAWEDQEHLQNSSAH